MKYISIQIGSTKFKAKVLEDKAPTACKAVLDALPTSGEARHSAWSGEGIVLPFRVKPQADEKLKQIDLFDVLWAENKKSILAPGEMLYHPQSQEIFIAYGENQWRSSIGGHFGFVFAAITENLDGLVKVCREIHAKGGKPFKITK